MAVTIYHNPRCSKSRQTLALLQDRELDLNIVEYLETPPTVKQLKRILRLLGATPRDILRRREEPYRELGLDSPELTDSQVLEAIVSHPVLMERPIVVAGDRAVIGRPPEKVLEII